jgi:hypothetical protein
MAEIQIVCPTCKTRGLIDVSKEAVDDVTRGLLAVNIAPNIICEHTFVAYIDKNMEVRNYFTADFQLELPKIKEKKRAPKLQIPGKDTIDIDLIKLNLLPMVFSYILKSIFCGKKVLLISEKQFLWGHLRHFFDYITQGNFEADISFITEEDYETKKGEYQKTHMIFDEHEVVNNLNDLIDPENLKIEKQIVNRFLSEPKLGYSYILLRNDLNMAYDFARELMEIVDNYDEKKTVGKKELINLLKEKTNSKISFSYLEFLIEIIEHYFSYDTSKISDYFIPNLGL